MTDFDSGHGNNPDRDTIPRTAKDLLDFGVESVAYIRPVHMMKQQLFAVHAADGSPISMAEDEGAALDLIRQNDLELVRLH